MTELYPPSHQQKTWQKYMSMEERRKETCGWRGERKHVDGEEKGNMIPPGTLLTIPQLAEYCS